MQLVSMTMLAVFAVTFFGTMDAVHYRWVICSQAAVAAGRLGFPTRLCPPAMFTAGTLHRGTIGPSKLFIHDRYLRNHCFNALITRCRTLTSETVVTC